MPQWPRRHASTLPPACPFWHTPRTVGGPIESSNEGPSGRVRIRPPRPPGFYFGTPLTRFMAP
eukprot:6325866-Pyramimonas_sp.AAC.1